MHLVIWNIVMILLLTITEMLGLHIIDYLSLFNIDGNDFFSILRFKDSK